MSLEEMQSPEIDTLEMPRRSATSIKDQGELLLTIVTDHSDL